MPTGTTSYFAGIEGAGHGDGSGAGDVVLGRLSPEQEHDSAARGHVRILAHITCRTARMPSPMMKSPPSPYASSIQPRAFQT